MTPDNALRQASMTAAEYADNALDALTKALNIDTREKEWRKHLAPFASVWAAMVTAAATDFDTAVRCGAVEGYEPLRAALLPVCESLERIHETLGESVEVMREAVEQQS